VRQALQSDFPDLGIRTLTALGEGWNSNAYLVNEEWVFRFPKRKDVEKNLQRELALLPELSQHLPVALPQFAFTALAPVSFPFIYAGYQKMPGAFAWDVPNDDLDQGAIAHSFAEVLMALHAFPPDRALDLGCEEEYTPFTGATRQRVAEEFAKIPPWPKHREYQERLHRYLDSVDISSLGAPERFLVIHGDLLPDHLLLPQSLDRISAIIDWGEVKVGDPAAEFAGLYYWLGRDFVDSVLHHYRLAYDPAMLERARFIALAVGIGDVWYGIDANLPAYLKVGLACLDHCLP
jgi:aminoglycoside 2''-phosphotransferase|tara:strand:- start:3635 stop:4510 length:876 start_codon:yes stop_codon:yes gene_type:complete